jgi:hypothetical protein
MKTDQGLCCWKAPVMKRIIGILLPGLLIMACAFFAPAPATSTPAPPATPDPASQLRSRRLQLLKLEPGTACPRAHGRQVTAEFGIAIGDGPVYAAGFGADGILNVQFPAPADSQFNGSSWSGAKVLWFIDPSYRGPVLIRGGRLDGPDQLRFETGANPPAELWIDAAPVTGTPDWRNRPSFTRLRAPGCYLYQADGTGFTETIIFEARAQQ